MRAYLGISKSNRNQFDLEIEMLERLLSKHTISLEVFVDKYQFSGAEEKQMMETAFDEIDHCDIMIVELTKKAIGVGIELGYAKARNIPIIYLKRKNAKHSTTAGGSSDFIIEYEDIPQLESALNKALIALKNQMD